MDEITNREGRAILFVSHNMAAIGQLCNRVILLNQGKIINSGEDVEGIIKKYLRDQSNDDATGTWERKDSRYDMEYVKLLKLTITNNQGIPENMPISNTEQIFLS